MTSKSLLPVHASTRDQVRLHFIIFALLASMVVQTACGDDIEPADDAEETDLVDDSETGSGDARSPGQPSYLLHTPNMGSQPPDSLGDIRFRENGEIVLVDPNAGTLRRSTSCTFEACESVVVDDSSFYSPVRIIASNRPVDGAELFVIDIGNLAPSDQKVGSIGVYGGSVESGSVIGGTFARPTSLYVVSSDESSLELVVTEFGANLAGSLTEVKVERTGEEWAESSRRVLLPNTGYAWVRPGDFNGDGDEDLAVSQSQREELIRVLTRTGETYQPRVVFDSDDSYFGLSDIQVVDFDFDGDDDIVFAHGDVLDSDIPDGIDPNDYNGVDLLENQGDGSFELQTLFRRLSTALIDVGDIDDDGDNDIVVATNINGEFATGEDAYTLAWFENDDGAWTEHALDTPLGFISSIQLLDLDEDGDLDIVATSLPQYTDADDTTSLFMFENRLAQ